MLKPRVRSSFRRGVETTRECLSGAKGKLPTAKRCLGPALLHPSLTATAVCLHRRLADQPIAAASWSGAAADFCRGTDEAAVIMSTVDLRCFCRWQSTSRPTFSVSRGIWRTIQAWPDGLRCAVGMKRAGRFGCCFLLARVDQKCGVGYNLPRIEFPGESRWESVANFSARIEYVPDASHPDC